jgi:hypothetical protein
MCARFSDYERSFLFVLSWFIGSLPVQTFGIARGVELRLASTNDLFPDPDCPVCSRTMANTETVIVLVRTDEYIRTLTGWEFQKIEMHALCLAT